MAWIWPAISAGTAIYSAVSAKNSTDKRNDQEVELANTAVTRRMADLKRAGINPALAYVQGGQSAQTPNLESYDFKPISDAGEKISNAYTASVSRVNMRMQNGLLAAQTNATAQQAAASAQQARKTGLEADILSASVPFSAANAEATARNLQANVSLLKNQVEAAARDNLIGDETQQARIELAKLATEYQRLVNTGEKLGLSEKEATAELWSDAEIAKWLPLIREAVGIAGNIGGILRPKPTTRRNVKE